MNNEILTVNGTSTTVDSWEDFYALADHRTIFRQFFDGIEPVQGYYCLVKYYSTEIVGYLPPAELALDEPTEQDLHRLLRMPVLVEIKRIMRKESMVILSQRTAVERISYQFWSTVEPGQVVTGILISPAIPRRSMQVEVSGVIGEVPGNEITWRQWVNPRDLQKMYPIYSEISAVVLEVDSEEKKLTLSLKRMWPDPWEKIVPQKYQPGKIMTGKVLKKHPHTEKTMVYFSDGMMCMCQGINGSKPGDIVTVKIQEVDPKERKMYGLLARHQDME